MPFKETLHPIPCKTEQITVLNLCFDSEFFMLSIFMLGYMDCRITTQNWNSQKIDLPQGANLCVMCIQMKPAEKSTEETHPSSLWGHEPS